MFEQQLDKLEGIGVQLSHIASLLKCMYSGYFDVSDPRLCSADDYNDMSNTLDIIYELVIGQKSTLDETTTKLYEVYGELKKLSEQNIALLKGGVAQ